LLGKLQKDWLEASPVSMANAGHAFNSQFIQGHSRNLKRSPQSDWNFE